MKRGLLLSISVLCLSTLTAQATTPVPEQKQNTVCLIRCDDSIALELQTVEVVKVSEQVSVIANDFVANAAYVKEKTLLIFQPVKDVGWPFVKSYSLNLNQVNRNKTGFLKENRSYRNYLPIRADC